jgi:hypothetical protein
MRVAATAICPQECPVVQAAACACPGAWEAGESVDGRDAIVSH